MLEFGGRDQADILVVARNHKAAARAVQQIFVDEVAQAEEAVDGRAVALHDVGDAASPVMRGLPCARFTRGIMQERLGVILRPKGIESS